MNTINGYTFNKNTFIMNEWKQALPCGILNLKNNLENTNTSARSKDLRSGQSTTPEDALCETRVQNSLKKRQISNNIIGSEVWRL